MACFTRVGRPCASLSFRGWGRPQRLVSSQSARARLRGLKCWRSGLGQGWPQGQSLDLAAHPFSPEPQHLAGDQALDMPVIMKY